jgi:ubiquinone/menaquinone biosynthesis C-methylase UbiE
LGCIHTRKHTKYPISTPPPPSSRDQVVDVGGGTGFCTLGIVKSIKPTNVTLIDQSPHQLAKARGKPALKEVTIMEVRGA